jgi:hypothetical protein
MLGNRNLTARWRRSPPPPRETIRTSGALFSQVGRTGRQVQSRF